MSLLRATKTNVGSALNCCSQMYRTATARFRLLPDFLIIGGQRCGTSSLYYYLMDYPGIRSAATKELHFFDERFAKGPRWYRSQFPSSLHKLCAESIGGQQFLTGEGTPYYIVYPHAPRRTFEMVPSAKLVALLRNPVDRAYSQYWIEVKSGFETLSFEDAISREEERIAEEYERMLRDDTYYSQSFRHFSYLRRGVYIEQLQNWLRYYPREQLLVLRSEDLFSNPAATLKLTLEFLGLPGAETERQYRNYRRPSKKGYRNKVVPPKIEPGLRRRLAEYFAPHNARLYDYLGVDFGWER